MKTWTSEEDELLVLYLNENISCRDVAIKMGKTRNAVIGRKARLGINSVRDKPKKEIVKLPSIAPVASFPNHGHCVYPIGDIRQDGFSFCGLSVNGRKQYCERHYKLCVRKAVKCIAFD